MATTFTETIASVATPVPTRGTLEVLQVNVGDRCNQQCAHCHINAGPGGNKLMPRPVMDEIIGFLMQSPGLTLDITGGCPEMNPFFRYLVEKAAPVTQLIVVRNNLTVLLEAGMEWLPAFYKMHKVKLICSLPCYTRENVDAQRGQGVFAKSIRALGLLNELGYGREPELELDLAYNPGGAFLPGKQAALEEAYRQNLMRYGVQFNHLITITNAPINRFRHYLQAHGNFDVYMRVLKDSFNHQTVGHIMCRTLLSVGWDGILYDCDFNQALGLRMRDRSGKVMEIGNALPGDIAGREIIFGEHCYCCTAGAGSSCQGALS